ncbi:MAG: DUF393 domain-containing protein [Deltaproteobacteria bacterium]|nr:MAG: DUF393 domain-containing protein [Deltaproteobacteria bacterium]
MTGADTRARTAHPPAERPLLVWDGDCGFCRRSAERIAHQVGGRLDTAPYQRVADRFPDIPVDSFRAAVHLIEPDGRVFTGAEAIYRALALRPGGGALHWCYRRLPGFAAASDLGYQFVANHRPLMSRLSRWLIGPSLLPSRYRVTRWLFLRLLGAIVFVAFWSMYVQMDGLFLSGGISPAAEFMAAVRRYADGQGWGPLARFVEAPTLAWLSASDGALTGFAVAGMVAGVLLALDIAPGAMVAAAWLLYLSLVQVGGIFFHYQWDALLIETLLCAMFVAPWRLRPGLARDPEPSRAGVWLFRVLLFKLMMLSGLVKLMEHGNAWKSLRALDVHFFTQPLPAPTSYWAHFAPHWLHAAALVVVFAIELVLPLFAFGPRRPRMAFGIGTIGLMLAIGLTGNYGFFNLLACAVALWCFDDAAIRARLPARLRARAPDPAHAAPPPPRRWTRRLAVALAVPITLIGAVRFANRLDPADRFGRRLADVVYPFFSINDYGLFQDMTESRPEIIVEGSRDGASWHAYEFRYKPGDPARAPRFAGLHMPRLDWQMWFAALRGCARARWFSGFIRRLFEARPEVRRLLAHDPFGDDPPRYLRTTVYDYTFAPPGEPGWWRRARPRPYCPVYARGAP